MASNVSLWPHQHAALEFAHGKSAVGLSMPMGTGKTLTCTALIDRWRPRSILVVATKKIATDPNIWPRHLREFLDEPYQIVQLSGETAIRRAMLYDSKPAKPTVYLVNFESVWREPLASRLFSRPPDLLLVDESHHAKSPSGTLSRFLFRLARRCPRKILATGTFLTHTPLDAWAQSRILDVSVLGGSFYKFRNRYAKLGGYMGKEVLSGKDGEPWLNQAELAIKLSRMWFTCERPPLPFETAPPIIRKFSMPPRSMKIYKGLEEDFVSGVGDRTVSAPLAITRLMRMLQVCSGFTKTDAQPGLESETVTLDTERSDLLAEVLQDIDQHERVAIFVGTFTHDLESIERAAKLAGRQYMEVSGSSSQLEEWKAVPGAVLGVHPKAGGEGLDFTHSRYVVFYSYQHSLGLYEQAMARVIRTPGPDVSKTDTRFVIYLMADGTLESDIVDGLQARKDVVQGLYMAIQDRLLTQ